MKFRTLTTLAIFLGLAVLGPTALAADPQQEVARPGISGVFTNPDSGSGTTLDRLVAAIGAHKAAMADEAKAAGAAMAANAELAPAAESLKSLEASLATLPPADLRNKELREVGVALTRAIEATNKRVEPLAAAAEKATKAAATAEVALKQAERELAQATAIWEDAVMAPARADAMTLASKLTVANAERDAAIAAKTGLETKVADFCRRNPDAKSLCDPAKVALQP